MSDTGDDNIIYPPGWNLDPDQLATEKVDDEAILAQIDKLSVPQYERRRQEFADMLGGIRVSELDRIVKARRRTNNDDLAGEEWSPTEIIPWPTAIPDLVPHLTMLAEILAEYVIFLSREATDAVALWCVTTHLHDLARWSPYLMVWSPEVESGKTSLLKIVIQLVQRAAPVANISTAMLYRVIAGWSPTLMIDQLDSLLKSGGERAEELRNILNSGHEKQFAYVVRGVGDNHQPRRFSTFCPKALGHQGRKPHPSIVSRSLVIELERKEARQTVKDDPASDPRFETLARILARWCVDHHDEVAAIRPVLPEGLGNRRGNNWRLMLAIAEAVGGEWPERAGRAALAISGGPVEESARIELLADIKALFDREQEAALASTDIVKALLELEDRLWAEWRPEGARTGKPITKNQIASLLAPLKIKPKQLWIAGKNQRGYSLADLAKAFAHYLPPGSQPFQNARSLDPNETATSEPFQNARTDQILAFENGLKATEHNGSSVLATQNPPTPGCEPPLTPEAADEPSDPDAGVSALPGWERRI